MIYLSILPNKICWLNCNLEIFTICISYLYCKWNSFFVWSRINFIRTWRYKSFFVPIVLDSFYTVMLSAISFNGGRFSSRFIDYLIEAHYSSKPLIFGLIHMSINAIWQKCLKWSLRPFIRISYLLTVFAPNISIEVWAIFVYIWTFISMITKFWTVICKDCSYSKSWNL